MKNVKNAYQNHYQIFTDIRFLKKPKLNTEIECVCVGGGGRGGGRAHIDDCLES